jgi:hypothetical protein
MIEVDEDGTHTWTSRRGRGYLVSHLGTVDLDDP